MNTFFSRINARIISAGKDGAKLIKPATDNKLAIRLLSVLVMSALLLPLIYDGSRRTVSAASNPSPLPVAAPPSSAAPAAFVSSSPGSLTSSALMSKIVEGSQAISGAYQFAADYFVSPPLPEGFGIVQVPTVRENIIAALGSALSSAYSIAAPPTIISPNNSTAAAKTKKANKNPADETAATDAESADTPDTAESSVETTVPAAALFTAPAAVKFDFDGDGKADVSRWQSSGEWKIKNSSTGSFDSNSLVGAGTAAAPADYDGDTKTDRAVFTDYSGTWKILKSSNNQIQTVTAFGQQSDKVVSADYDGDGIADLALWRPSTGTWYVRQSSNLQVVSTQFGASGDIPVPGNYDGDSKMDYAVYRPSTGVWHVLLSGSGYSYSSLAWGAGTDIPVPADYDGDGKTDYSVYRPGNGTWYVLQSSTNNVSYQSKIWGNYGDQPVPADYDNDGKADYAVWRPTTGVWYIAKSSAGYNAYDYHQLGIATDTAVPSAYLKQIGGQVLAYNLANARLAPINATGGTDLYSRNFGWGTGLVGLSGRAGLDAGLSISYNSLVWTKEPTSNTMVFDADHANVAPGFNFGFPSIEPGYYNGLTQKFSYLMVTPSGGRVEFRQEAASNIYNTADSSYAQLKVNTPGGGGPQTPTEDVTLTVTTTDGTMLDYDWKAGAYRLNKITDRNGNFISVTYDSTYGLLTSVKDTLERVITINYDSEFYPTSITQQWKSGNGDGSAVTHTYATFTYAYTTMTPAFATGIGVFGPSGGASIKVLNHITYADNSTTSFLYNTYGQVSKITHKAADNHELSYIQTDLGMVSGTPSDCPRISVVKNYAENFNGGAETVTHIDFAVNQPFTFDGGGTGTSVEVKMDGAPHSPISKTWFYPAGNWGEGLPFATEDTADGSRQRWTRTVWTQDNTNLVYKLNPRVLESKVGDAVNVKRTELSYLTTGNLVGYGLVGEVKIYDGNTNALQKKSVTSYKDDAAYMTRRIIGLPAQSELYDGLNAPMAKVIYGYDEGNLSDSTLQQNISPIQHDNTNYTNNFIVGRGNTTSVTRYDVVNSATITSSLKYNTAGAVVAKITPWTGSSNRTIKIDYTDNFNDGVARSTYAYPKVLTDPAGYSSTIKYRYDTGANVEASSPTPYGTNLTSGKHTTRLYDSLGRLERETINNTGAYTRYQYFTNGTQLKSFSTITAGLGEVESENVTDGAGRVTKTRTALPGSSNRIGSKVVYDKLGRVTSSSVPTEIDANWNAAGDDLTRGYLWNSQEYDWKGRVTKKTNTDGTFQSISYAGCGCAGGQVTTIEGEEIFTTAWDGSNPVSLGKRTQKIYADVLGRDYKTEVLNWNGGSVYSTTLTEFNGRDQATTVTKTQAATTTPAVAAISQEWTMSYDGFGRLKTQHRPEQVTATGTPASTTYNYNPDDSISTVVDARGASAAYTYNSRGLVELIDYTKPSGSTTVPDAADVMFTYDDAGNRKQMTDGLGTVDYTYTELSQLKTEKRTFTDTLADAPAGGNAFLLSYDYTLSGQLKYVTDPYGQQFNYTYDAVGRLTTVAGSTAFAGITTYASNPVYNARGTLTALTYGNGVQMNISGFNNKLQATDFEVKKGTDSYIKKAYKFYEDGSLKFIDDQLSDTFDRSYKYDFAGRTIEAKAGVAARGGTSTDPNKLDQPYTMSYKHDAFGHITNKTGYYYSSQDNNTYSFNANDRNPGWSYDDEGNITADNDAAYEIDAAGRIVTTGERNLDNSSQFDAPTLDYFNGDGQLEKRISNSGNVGTTTPPEMKRYFMRSSVLGKVISEADATGKKLHTYVPANGTTLATQTTANYNGTTEVLTFNHTDASGTGAQETNSSGALTGNTTYNRTGEYTPLGRNIADIGPYITLNTSEPGNEGGVDLFGSGQGYRPGQNTYKINGMVVPESFFIDTVINSGDIGGAFGLLEIATRMSAQPPREIGHWERTWTWGSEGANGSVSTNTMTRTTSTVYAANNWQAIASLATLSTDYLRQLDKTETSSLRGLVKNLVDNKKCADFIKNLLNVANQIAPKANPGASGQMFITDDILSIFDKVSQDGGFFTGGSGPNTISGTFLYNTPITFNVEAQVGNTSKVFSQTVNYNREGDRPRVLLSFNFYFPRGPQDPNYNDFSSATLKYQRNNLFSSSGGAFTTLHELIHFNFHDVYLASAVAIINGDTTVSFPKNLAEANDSDTRRASRYWDKALHQNCDPNYKAQ